MAYSPARFALGVLLRAAAIGILIFAGLFLAITRHWYASAAVAGGVALLVGLDLARSAAAVDRTLAQFVDGLFAEGYERPGSVGAPTHKLTAAIDRALDRLGQTRAERQRRFEYVQALVDNIAAAVLVVDETGAIEFANRAARRRLGETAPTLAQMSVLGAAAVERLAVAAPGTREIIFLADGQRMLASVGAFSSPGGPRRRLIALQSVAGDLDPVELSAWRDLARILAHEMMNSLTPICSLAEALPAMIGDASPDATEALEIIARRSEALMGFIDRYRKLAELPTPEAVQIGAAPLLAGLETLMGGLMGAHRVRFETLAEPAGLKLVADPQLLEQALINLLKNALDAVDGRDDAVVRLTCAQEGEFTVLTVSDNGPGLPDGAAEEVFVPFFTTKASGSGIGLTLARQIALAHGGRVEHRRAEPTGAVFRLVLPGPA